VAVLPFQNLGGDEATGYLSVAVPDEIITALSRVEALAVRPFASTAGYTTAPIDLAEVGAAARAVNLITGQYYREGQQLSLTMEAIDVDSNRLLWRESVTVAADDLLSLRAQVADQVNTGLVPILAPQAVVTVEGTAPTNLEAYELYLKSLAVQREPIPNKQAVEMLERAVELDPGYARFWAELALRLHFDAHYGEGGAEAYRREAEAIDKALVLDPDQIGAAERKAIFLADQGKLGEALAIADQVVERHPESGEAYFARSYVRRYASLIDEAIADCEKALELDPTHFRWRSCGVNFVLNGTYERAWTFYQLDETSDFYQDAGGHLRLSAGNIEAAIESWAQLPDGYLYQVEYHLIEACHAGEGAEEHLSEMRELMAAERDPETLYFAGQLFVFCGEVEEGFDLVRRGSAAPSSATTALPPAWRASASGSPTARTPASSTSSARPTPAAIVSSARPAEAAPGLSPTPLGGVSAYGWEYPGDCHDKGTLRRRPAPRSHGSLLSFRKVGLERGGLLHPVPARGPMPLIRQ
jgi:TolB-like protein